MSGRGKPRRDIYAEVTETMLSAMEKGVAPWVRPWRSLGTSGDLRNGATGYAYNGVNVFLLSLRMSAEGWADPRFVTFKQARAMGGHVRKGEKGSLVVFWKQIVKRDRDDDGEARHRAFPVLKHYVVFNAEAQCDGVALDGAAADQLPELERDARCEAFLQATGADIRHGGSRAFYSPAPLDYIGLPRPETFRDAGAYYATAFHELAHWTGDASRCDRLKGKRFGDARYAFEELVAELGSAFLCRKFDVDGTLQHPAYLASWAKVLRDDKKAIFSAASKARKACEYLAERTGAEAEGAAA